MKKKSRKTLLFYNSASTTISQIVSLVCNFALTRLILSGFGSETNGLVSSISQFLGFISFLELGIGTVVKSALYKPLAENDTDQISRVVVSAKKFFNKIGLILVLYTAILAVIFPLISMNSYEPIFTASLVLIIAISLFAQYFIGMPYQLLLNADQRTYIPTIICTSTLIINTVLSAILIELDASIQIVKLATSIIYVARPILYSLYVHKNYNLNEKIVLTEEPIKQKWNGMAQHLAYVVVNHTDVAVLTLFSTLENVSIYTVYHNVTIGIQQVINCFSIGITAMLGNVLYSENKDTLKKTFGLVEWIFHVSTVLLFAITGLLIVPFVKVYTLGIDDAEYILPIFAALLTLAQASYSIRVPYQEMVLASNHFKDTQKSAIIEVILNIGISVALVYKLGLIGVTIGTFVAMTYRTIYYVIFLSKNVLDYKVKTFIKYIIVDTIEVLACVFSCIFVFEFEMSSISILAWIWMAIQVSIVCLLICAIVNFVIYRDYVKKILDIAFGKFKRR